VLVIFFAVLYGLAHSAPFVVHLIRGGDSVSAFSEDQGVAHYEDTRTGFSFDYPTYWIKTRVATEGQPQAIPVAEVTFANPSGSTHMGLGLDYISVVAYQGETTFTVEMKPIMAEALEQLLLQGEGKMPGFEIVEPVSEFTTASGLSGVRTEYRATIEGQDMQMAAHLIASGRMLYQIDTQAARKEWKKNTPFFDAVIRSFRITGI
jgi:hypothetical protein